MRFLEDERVWRLPGLLYADDYIICSESDKDLRVMVDSMLKCVREDD